MSTESLAPVDTVPAPNPNAIMLKVQETLVPSGTHEFTRGDDTAGSPLATALLALEGIELVLIAPRESKLVLVSFCESMLELLVSPCESL